MSVLNNIIKARTPAVATGVVPATSDLPHGEAYTIYRVAGVWMPDGSITVPEKVMVEVEGGRRADNVGDELHLTRREAAVVGKHVVLVPVI